MSPEKIALMVKNQKYFDVEISDTQRLALYGTVPMMQQMTNV